MVDNICVVYNVVVGSIVQVKFVDNIFVFVEDNNSLFVEDSFENFCLL